MLYYECFIFHSSTFYLDTLEGLLNLYLWLDMSNGFSTLCVYDTYVLFLWLISS